MWALRANLVRMDVETAIRTRRTHKVYAPEPVEPELLEERLLDLLAEGAHRTG